MQMGPTLYSRHTRGRAVNAESRRKRSGRLLRAARPAGLQQANAGKPWLHECGGLVRGASLEPRFRRGAGGEAQSGAGGPRRDSQVEPVRHGQTRRTGQQPKWGSRAGRECGARGRQVRRRLPRAGRAHRCGLETCADGHKRIGQAEDAVRQQLVLIEENSPEALATVAALANPAAQMCIDKCTC